MAVEGIYQNLELLVRWIHVLAGIVWIGHLYFFNFVNVPFQGTIDKDMKKVVNPNLIGRALFWFRWGAMTTFIAGLILFTQVYMYTPGEGGGFGPSSNFSSEGAMSQRSMWILAGMLFGTVMWFNVWFIIWPAQQKILPWVRDGQAPPEMAAMAKRALLASRINTFLSGPMLFGMLAPAHYASINFITFLVVVLVALAVVWHLIKVSPKVGTSV